MDGQQNIIKKKSREIFILIIRKR